CTAAVGSDTGSGKGTLVLRMSWVMAIAVAAAKPATMTIVWRIAGIRYPLRLRLSLAPSAVPGFFSDLATLALPSWWRTPRCFAVRHTRGSRSPQREETDRGIRRHHRDPQGQPQ